MIEADGILRITSLVTVTVEVPAPSTPFASVYATETGIIIVYAFISEEVLHVRIDRSDVPGG